MPPPGTYYSVLTKRADDPRDLATLMQARIVINQEHSHSGHAALWMAARERGLAPNITGESGGHIQSARMIAADEADLAILDAVSWALMQRYDAFAEGLTTVGRSPATAAMPYICAPGVDAGAVRAAALAQALADLPQDRRETLHIRGLVPHPRVPPIATCPTRPRFRREARDLPSLRAQSAAKRRFSALHPCAHLRHPAPHNNSKVGRDPTKAPSSRSAICTRPTGHSR